MQSRSPKAHKAWKREQQTSTAMKMVHATEDTRSPLQLFQLCFSRATMTNLCRNTNKYVAGKKATGRKAKWYELEVQELYKFLEFLIYNTLLSPSSHRQLLEAESICSVFSFINDKRQILNDFNRHPSDQEEDKNNDAKRGITQRNSHWYVPVHER